MFKKMKKILFLAISINILFLIVLVATVTFRTLSEHIPSLAFILGQLCVLLNFIIGMVFGKLFSWIYYKYL